MEPADDGRVGKVLPLREPCDLCGDDHHSTDRHVELDVEFWESLRANDYSSMILAEPSFELTDEEPPPPEFSDEEQRSGVRRKGDDTSKVSSANRQRPVRPGAFDRGDQVEMAERLLKVLQGKGPALVRDDGALYRYETADGVWREVTQGAQSCIVQDFAGSEVTGDKKSKDLKVSASDVSGAIRLAGDRALHPGYFTSEHCPVGIAFADGFVTIGEYGPKNQPHDPANRARSGFEFKYEPDAEPRMFLKFLNDIFVDDADRREKIAFVQEFGGIALLGLGPQFQKCFVATSSGVSNGQNGKSQLAEIFRGIMPHGSVSEVRPQDFENEYRRAMLAGKLMNIVGEMPEGDILDSTSFKSIITGDQIDGRHIRQSPFGFKPRAAHYYACNQPPGTSDFSRAFFRRFVFITFNRVFREGTADHIPDIGRKIVRAERALIAAWFLTGASRAMTQGEYTKVPSSTNEIEAWRKSVDQVAMFLADLAEKSKSPEPKGSHDWSGAARVYEGYKQWAHESGHKPLASNKFALRMELAGHAAVHTKKGNFYPVRPTSGVWPVSTR